MGGGICSEEGVMMNCDFTNHMGGEVCMGGNLFSSGEGGAPEVFFLKSAKDIHSYRFF